MSIGTIDKLASPNEFGDDRDQDDVKLREVETLEEILRLTPDDETDVDSDLEGGRTLFSDRLPVALGSSALGATLLQESARASTRNAAAGTTELAREPAYLRRRAPYLGNVAVGRRRVQGFPIRPGR